MFDCDECLVRNRAICSALEPDELAMLGKLGRKQQVARGQTLVWEGDESLVVANVIRGVLKLSVSTADGREQIVGVVFPSDFIGRPFGKESPYGITALTEAEVCIFTRSAFDSFAKDHPNLQHKLLQRTLDELDRARQWMMLLGRKTASERIATLLIEVSNRLGATGCSAIEPFLDRFELPMDRQQMGDVLGLTIETVSRQLTKLKDADIIELPDRRSVIIKDRRRLEDLSVAA
ncbi:Crp cAMP-binding proteins - catabolite gene activator and regulatory subunit of cAMP-dependent protein kinases [Sphingomonadaceae bacterium]|jgi:CRP/FNR family transcriptional regulator|uniref:Crp/Fnr family transcriptional regulator n=1 Tax=Sphingorhabdus sp. TaxID=1902408 RepID=UPI00308C8392|nr:Crp/Fnr family transcriptional regulator [Sphingomonadales bacterium]WRH76043.1 MAG: Crp/Fnr family transcriptional regulator [Sphingobium sp.]